MERARRKVARLEKELAGGAHEAARLRSAADLLMANLKGLKRGQAQIQVNDFDGAPRLLELDPALSPAANAEAWYAQARKRERAVQQLPALIEKARQETAELQHKLERVRTGETPDLPPTAAPRNKPERKLPYHRFRTSGGLEVRVGRNSKANDELTLQHCAPDDIWLHARAVGGAHVVLRWSDPANNPPKLDLEQAAALAALHSKARHAGVVPIDWTRRKYVRKPRQAPPGSVLVERVKTVFVSPKESLVDALRWTE
jgi:predicted ribosome quality control (RQC) complex YloA/Tae2 family protein